jgi:alcohol dehydrogenase YqhD (iron-dependent ADH family)
MQRKKINTWRKCFFKIFNLRSNSNYITKRQIQNGVIDALHVMEQYLTCPIDALCKIVLPESILHTLVEIGPDAVENPSDYKYSNYMWCNHGFKRTNPKGVQAIGQPT